MKTTKQDRKVWRVNYLGSTQYAEMMLTIACDDLDTLEQRLKICEEALGFYGSPESWIIRDKHAWRKSSPRSHGDDENILDYHHPNRDWVGTVAVGGKRARQALAESAKIAASEGGRGNEDE